MTIKLLMALALAISPSIGHAKKKTHTPRLRPLTSYIDFQKTNSNITLRAKRLSLEDCQSLFGKRAKLLFKKKRRRQPVYPIQLSITNKTESPIVLKPENISLKLTPYKRVASRLKHNAVLQVIGGIACALITAGLLFAGGALVVANGFLFTTLFGSMGAALSAPLFVAGLSAAIVTPFFLVIGTPIVPTLKGIQSVRKNTIIRQELKNKSLHEGVHISKGHTIDTLIFVSRPALKRNFTVSLVQPKTNTQLVSFDVELQEEYHE